MVDTRAGLKHASHRSLRRKTHESCLAWHVRAGDHLSLAAGALERADRSAKELHWDGVCEDSYRRIHDGMLVGRHGVQARRETGAQCTHHQTFRDGATRGYPGRMESGDECE